MQQLLTILLEQDRPALEKHVGFYLRTLFQEFFGMVQFEIEIMIIRLRTEPDFLYYDLGLLCFKLLLLFTLLIKELTVIGNLTNRWICTGRDLYEIESEPFRNLQGLLQANNSCVFYIFPNNTNNTGTNLIIDPELFPKLISLAGCPLRFGLVNNYILLKLIFKFNLRTQLSVPM